MKGKGLIIIVGNREVHRGEDVTGLMNGSRGIGHRVEMTRVRIICHLLKENIAEGMKNNTITEKNRPPIHKLPALIDAINKGFHHPETTIKEINITLDETTEVPKNMINAAVTTTRKGTLFLGAKTKRESVICRKKYTPTSKNAKDELTKTVMKFTGTAFSGSRRPR